MMQEYLDLEHAELVPPEDLNKPVQDMFYMPYACGPKGSEYYHKTSSCF